MEIIEIRCPECNKWIGEKEVQARADGIFFWCPRCKKKIIVKNNRAQVANKS